MSSKSSRRAVAALAASTAGLALLFGASAWNKPATTSEDQSHTIGDLMGPNIDYSISLTAVYDSENKGGVRFQGETEKTTFRYWGGYFRVHGFENFYELEGVDYEEMNNGGMKRAMDPPVDFLFEFNHDEIIYVTLDGELQFTMKPLVTSGSVDVITLGTEYSVTDFTVTEMVGEGYMKRVYKINGGVEGCIDSTAQEYQGSWTGMACCSDDDDICQINKDDGNCATSGNDYQKTKDYCAGLGNGRRPCTFDEFKERCAAQCRVEKTFAWTRDSCKGY